LAYSVVLELEDGGTVIYDNVVSCTVEEAEEPIDEDIPEEGEPDRGEEVEVEEIDMTPAPENPMCEEEEAS
jgi:hypothetical protein